MYDVYLKIHTPGDVFYTTGNTGIPVDIISKSGLTNIVFPYLPCGLSTNSLIPLIFGLFYGLFLGVSLVDTTHYILKFNINLLYYFLILMYDLKY